MAELVAGRILLVLGKLDRCAMQGAAMGTRADPLYHPAGAKGEPPDAGKRVSIEDVRILGHVTIRSSVAGRPGPGLHPHLCRPERIDGL